MVGITVTPDNFDAEVLSSDKPVLVILLPINYGNEADPNDDKVEIYDWSLEGFKSEVQKTVGDKYKVALVDYRYETRLNLFGVVPRMFPPPLPFSVFEGGRRTKTGFFLGGSKEILIGTLKDRLDQAFSV